VVIDDGLIEDAIRFRADARPSETGGIILGTIDLTRRQICAVMLVPAPADSFGDQGGFERGVEDLSALVRDVARRTAGQVQYVGEWHSHPKGVAPSPSATDLKQLIWLG